MLSIANLTNVENAAHYFEIEDYYSKDDPEHKKLTSWYGKGAERLGLEGQINSDDLKQILNGVLPNGDVLGRKGKGGEREHAVGIDATFSAPKSVSIMALVANDKRLIKAHEKAVKQTLSLMEENHIGVRVRSGGIVERQKVDNMTVGMFRHSISRNQDPQLHTHCVIANVVQKDNGDWRSAYLKKIFDDKKEYLGAWYRGVLAHECKKLGYDIVNQGKECFFEIGNISQEAIKEFSTRSEEIKDLVGKNATAEEKAAAALKTRKSKPEGIDRDKILEGWQGKVKQNNLNLAISYPSGIVAKSNMAVAKEAVQFAIDTLGERNSVFKKATILNIAQTYKLGEVSPEFIEKRVNDLINNVKLLKSRSDTYKEYFTTPELLAMEKETIDIMRKGKGVYTPLNPKIDLTKSALNSGQRSAVTSIFKTTDRVIAIQGYAGTGKSFMLNEARKLLEKKKYEFIGLAPTGKATQNLKIKSSIKECGTFQGFLQKYHKIAEGNVTEQGMKDDIDYFANKVVVIDEAGMVSTNQMRDFLEISRKLNFRVVLIGDTKQLESVEAGNPFQELQNEGVSIEIVDDIKRQTNRNLKIGVYSAISGNIEEAFKQIGTNIVEFGIKDDPNKSKAEIAEAREANKDMGEILVAGKYLSFSDDDRKDTIVVAQSNKSKELINDNIRQGLIKEGKIKGASLKNFKYLNKNLEEAKKKKTAYYNAGDIILFNKKIDYLGVDKGSYAKVTNVNQANNNLTIEYNGKSTLINPEKVIGTRRGVIEVFEEMTVTLQKGDKIVFTRSASDESGILNAQEAQIDAITKKDIRMTLFDDGKKTKKIKIPLASNLLKHIDYSYCSTVHKAQGSDAKYVIAMAESWRRNLTTQKNFYVEISRAKEEAFLFVDDSKKLSEQLTKNTGIKISALEHQRKGEKEDDKYLKLDVSKEDLENGFKAHAVKEFGTIEGVHIAVEKAIFTPQEKIRFGDKNSHEVSWNGEAGYIKDFKSGKYSSFNGTSLIKEGAAKYTKISKEEASQIKEKQREAITKQEQEALEQQQKVSDKATKWYKGAKRYGKSDYLVRKGLDKRGLENIRYSDFGMLMPLRDVEGKIWSMQIIKDDGQKIMMKDGRKRGNFFVIGEDKLEKSDTIFISEGLATGGSVYKAVKSPVVVAVDAGNLEDVTRNIQAKYPDKELIVAADNDCWKKYKNTYARKKDRAKDKDDVNKGLDVAKKIEKDLGIKYIFPEFRGEYSGAKNTDFNDLAKLSGDKEVVKQIKKQCEEQKIFVKYMRQKQVDIAS